jgi:hypothetical protein
MQDKQLGQNHEKWARFCAHAVKEWYFSFEVGRNNQRALRRMGKSKHPVQCTAFIAPYAG